VRRVADFAHRFEAGAPDPGVKLLEFLRIRLSQHILREDMAYSGFLREKMKARSNSLRILQYAPATPSICT
jgi:hemerythrin